MCVFVRCVCDYHLCELLWQHFNFPLWMNNLLYRSIFIYLCITIDPSAIHTSLHLSIVHQSIDVSFPSKMSSHSRSFPHPLSLILSLSLALSLSVALSVWTCPSPSIPSGGKELALAISSCCALQIASAWTIHVMCATDVWAAWLL